MAKTRYLRLVVRAITDEPGSAYFVAPALVPAEVGRGATQPFWKLDIASVRDGPGEDVAAYRNHLFRTLFPGSARELVRRSGSEFAEEGTNLVVLLDLPLGEVTSIPWECATPPFDEDEFDWERLEMTILRHVGLLPSGRRDDRKRKRRILIISSNPKGANLPDLSSGIEAELRALPSSLADVVHVIKHDSHTSPHIKSYIETLTDADRLEGVYFVGHGDIANGKVGLYFRDSHGKPELVTGDKFVHQVLPRSVAGQCDWIVFNCCFSAGGTGWPSSNLSLHVAQTFRVPLIVGFSGRILDKDASLFGAEFFSQLTNRESLVTWLGNRQRFVNGSSGLQAIVDQAVCFVRSNEVVLGIYADGGGDARGAHREDPSPPHLSTAQTISSPSHQIGEERTITEHGVPHETSPGRPPDQSAGNGRHRENTAGGRREAFIFVPKGRARGGYTQEQRRRVTSALGRFNLAPSAIDDALGSSRGEEEIGGFHLGTYLVTNREFFEFTQSDGYVTEASQAGADWEEFLSDRPDHPVVRVTWHDAVRYCKWKGGRLPTIAEWRRACRGESGRVYPWGDEFDPAKCNTYESGIATTSSVTDYPEGVSEFGFFDMVGNVEEWTQTPMPRGYAVVGGSYEMSCELYGLPSTHRIALASFFSDELGFRCASDQQPDN